MDDNINMLLVKFSFIIIDTMGDLGTQNGNVAKLLRYHIFSPRVLLPSPPT